jgi:hypothetical protein
MTTYEEIQEATELLEKEGYLVRKATENLGRPYIGILNDLLEKEGYWIDEAMIERQEDYSITGRIRLCIIPKRYLLNKKETS